MRYWLYKCNTEGGPAGYWGHWRTMVFHKKSATEWGGHYATRSTASRSYIENDAAPGDVVVAYQTDDQEVVGFCVISNVKGPSGDKKLYLKPIELLTTPFKIHRHKQGTSLEGSWVVRGPSMLAELSRENMEDLIALSGAPKRVLQGKPKARGYQP